MRKLSDTKAPVRLKLSAHWAAVMFCYIYGDYFGLYRPGKIEGMMAGRIAPLGAATDGVLVGVSAMMAIPSVMVALAVTLPATLNKWLNVLLGLAYTGIIVVTMIGAPPFYLFLGVIEAALTLTIAWLALTWPREL